MTSYFDIINRPFPINYLEPRLSLFSTLVVERETLLGPDHVTSQNLGGKKNWMAEMGGKVKKLLLEQFYCLKVKNMVLPKWAALAK